MLEDGDDKCPFATSSPSCVILRINGLDGQGEKQERTELKITTEDDKGVTRNQETGFTSPHKTLIFFGSYSIVDMLCMAPAPALRFQAWTCATIDVTVVA